MLTPSHELVKKTKQRVFNFTSMHIKFSYLTSVTVIDINFLKMN